MQEKALEILKNPKAWLALHVPEAMAGLASALITLVAILVIHRITRRRPNPRWVHFDQDQYLDESISGEELEQGFNRNY